MIDDRTYINERPLICEDDENDNRGSFFFNEGRQGLIICIVSCIILIAILAMIYLI